MATLGPLPSTNPLLRPPERRCGVPRIARRGVLVKRLQVKDVEDLLHFREALEGLGLGWCPGGKPG